MALRLWEIMVLTLVIQIGILPLMALYFHRITLVGPLANVSAILLAAIIVPLGFVALSASLIWSALGHALGFVLAPFIGALVAWTDWFARFPWSSYRVPTPPWPLLAAFFAVLIVCSVESILAGDREPLTADFLKIPHHGSRTSTTGEFLGAVGPRFVVVSVGESNPFGPCPVPKCWSGSNPKGAACIGTEAVTAPSPRSPAIREWKSAHSWSSDSLEIVWKCHRACSGGTPLLQRVFF